MKSGPSLLDRLVRESFELRMETHPLLKRMVLRSACRALRQVTPDTFHTKCHAASLAMQQLLLKVGVRSSFCCGTVKWQFGGVMADGQPWQEEAGFWTPNPDLPAPHTWLLTEFGGLIDLSCSYFHFTYGEALKAHRSHDVIPTIWMKTENLAQLPSLNYTMTDRYSTADLANCDDLARQLVAVAEINFEDSVRSLVAAANEEPIFDGILLDGRQSLEKLKLTNSWVARNSVVTKPPFHGLLRPPT